jgi:hypothetical protein
MPFFPVLHQFFAVGFNPFDRFIQHIGRSRPDVLKSFQADTHVDSAARQMHMRWQVVALPQFQSVLVAEAVLCRHARMILKLFLYIKWRVMNEQTEMIKLAHRFIAIKAPWRKSRSE